MLATIALIGRPNVGKSTLFNRLIRSNKAITHDQPGVTRDRIYGLVRPKDGVGRPFGLVDTGGLVPDSEEDMELAIRDQADEAVAEAQAMVLVVDGREGLTMLDEHVATRIRQSNKPVLLVVNKVDGSEHEDLAGEFHALGFDLVTVSASHGYGIPQLMETLEAFMEKHGIESEEEEFDEEKTGLRISMVGRPNAGKSSMINACLGERRLIVSDVAGTTRDSVDVTFRRKGKTYTFVDTAGVRRKAKITDTLEQFSVVKALKTNRKAQVAILVIDGTQSLSHQDKRILSFLDREKTPLIIAVNKMDLMTPEQRKTLKAHFEHELRIMNHVPIVFTSTVTRAGLGGLMPLADKVYEECTRRVSTGELNRVLKNSIERHQPPLVKRRRAKFYYLTQADILPPTFVFFVNDPELVKTSYQRYLEGQLRKLVGLKMAPVQVHFRGAHKARKKGK